MCQSYSKISCNQTVKYLFYKKDGYIKRSEVNAIFQDSKTNPKSDRFQEIGDEERDVSPFSI